MRHTGSTCGDDAFTRGDETLARGDEASGGLLMTVGAGPGDGGLLARIVSNDDNVQAMIWASFVIVIVGIVATARTIRSVARERTRREIAAFIAEGSMTPEQGERLMKSGRNEC
jgi:hypothetical protein